MNTIDVCGFVGYCISIHNAKIKSCIFIPLQEIFAGKLGHTYFIQVYINCYSYGQAYLLSQ